jgi:hypothetical protein
LPNTKADFGFRGAPSQMLLTISTTHHPAIDLGYLLRKNPAKARDYIPFLRK